MRHCGEKHHGQLHLFDHRECGLSPCPCYGLVGNEDKDFQDWGIRGLSQNLRECGKLRPVQWLYRIRV